jgi:20S proteasome subunit alpha 1
VRGKDSVVLLTEKRISDRFIDPESVTNIFNVSPKVGCLTTGLARTNLPNAADARNIVTRLRYEAAGFKYEFGHDVPVDFLASRLADYNQLNTQKAMQRVFGAEAIIAGIDEEKGPALFKVDPSGFYAGYKAVSAGVKEQDAINAMEKQSKKKGWDLSLNEAVNMAITTMQTVPI